VSEHPKHAPEDLWDADGSDRVEPNEEQLIAGIIYATACRYEGHESRCDVYGCTRHEHPEVVAVQKAIATYRVKLQAEARREALELLDRMHEALIFCSGSPDFAKGGQAELGWDRCCRPVLSDMQDHYAARRALGESEPEKLPLGHEFQRHTHCEPACDSLSCDYPMERCAAYKPRNMGLPCGQPAAVHRVSE